MGDFVYNLNQLIRSLARHSRGFVGCNASVKVLGFAGHDDVNYTRLFGAYFRDHEIGRRFR